MEGPPLRPETVKPAMLARLFIPGDMKTIMDDACASTARRPPTASWPSFPPHGVRGRRCPGEPDSCRRNWRPSRPWSPLAAQDGQGVGSRQAGTSSSINRPSMSCRPDGAEPSTWTWTGFVRAKGFFGVSVTTSVNELYTADVTLMTLAFLAVKDLYVPAIANRYIPTLSAWAAFTAPLKSTATRVTMCFRFCTNWTSVTETSGGEVGVGVGVGVGIGIGVGMGIGIGEGIGVGVGAGEVVGVVTVICVEPLSPSREAVIVEVPCATP